MFRSACGGFCTWCHNKFYERPDAFRQIFWSFQDIVAGLHYGIEFCPPACTAIVAVAIWFLFFPGQLSFVRTQYYAQQAV